MKKRSCQSNFISLEYFRRILSTLRVSRHWINKYGYNFLSNCAIVSFQSGIIDAGHIARKCLCSSLRVFWICHLADHSHILIDYKYYSLKVCQTMSNLTYHSMIEFLQIRICVLLNDVSNMF